VFQYVSIPLKDLGSGIDQLSKESQIPEGFSEDLINIDPQPEGSLKKRAGYQKVAGNIPVRVNKITHEGTKICFYLDAAGSRARVNLGKIRSSPIIVKGRLGAPSLASPPGDFIDGGVDNTRYYSGFESDTRLDVSLGLNTFVIQQSEHGLSTPYIWATLIQSTDAINESNILVYPDEVLVDDITKEVTVSFTNNDPAFTSAFVFLVGHASSSGKIYTGPYDVLDAVPVALSNTFLTGTHVYTVTAAQHGLSNLHVIPKVILLESGVWSEVYPDEVVIDGNTGEISVTVTNSTVAALTGVLSLESIPDANYALANLEIGNNYTVTLPLDPILGSNFLNVAVYDTDETLGIQELVLADRVEVDAVNSLLTVQLSPPNAPTGRPYGIMWSYAEVLSNVLCVEDTLSVSTSYEDLKPQLTLWGLDQSEIYSNETEDSRAGWATHLDTYKAAAEVRLISGAGGNIFREDVRLESGAEYLMPSLLPNLRGRTTAPSVVGPAFIGNSSTPTRTAGNIEFAGGESGWGKVTTITYVGPGTRYRISTPSKTVHGLLSSILDTTAGQQDNLTVTGTGWRLNAGSFKILSVDNSNAAYLDIVVDNPSRDSADFDEQDAGALGGVFTDKITVASTSFLPEDRVLSDAFTEAQFYTVLRVNGGTLVLSDLVTDIPISQGLLITGRRTSSLIPLRSLTGSSVVNVVRGDMLSHAPLQRKLNVLHVNPKATAVASAVGDGIFTTLTVTGGVAHLSPGQRIHLIGAEFLIGEFPIFDVASGSEVVIASEFNGMASVTILGNTVEVDEEFTWEDSARQAYAFEVASRWIPVEAPTSDFNLVPKTHFKYLTGDGFDEQSFLRSSISNDNMYFSNGADQVLKYDGARLYREQFLTVSTPGKIVVPNTTSAVTAVTNNRLTVAIGDELKYPAGSKVKYTPTAGTPANYIVTQTASSTSLNVGYVYVSTAVIGPVTGSLEAVHIFSYYFRLNAIDANQNLIASAVTGSQDYKVELSADSTVRIKLVGMPVWDIYDFDRLEVEIYRTKGQNAAPYYHIATIPMSFDAGEGYFLYEDYNADDGLFDLDPINTALFGSEVGTQLSHPLRSQYITSAGNRLILGNVKADPALTVQYYDNGKGTGIPRTDLLGQTWTLKRDITDTLNTTDNTNRQRFEFVDAAGAYTIAPSTDITRTTTSFTVAISMHLVVPGGWVYLYRENPSPNHTLRCAGWYMVDSVTPGTITILEPSDGSALTVDDVDKLIYATSSLDIPVALGTDYNFGMANGNRAGSGDPYESIAMRRLAAAINAAQRQVSLTKFPAFTPWITAAAGGEFATGQLVLKQPKNISTRFGVITPSSYTGGMKIAINDIFTIPATSEQATVNTYPSRVLISEANYPELFDNPTSVLDSSSRSAIDINPADGQEITGLIPFFGESAFGSAQKSGVVVVFKQNSIYLIDTYAKAAGQNPVQRIETEGLGCTAPYSIAPTRGGVMFANESGIYRLGHDLTISYIGRRLERLWQKGTVNRSALNLLHGHNYALGRQYKLSFASGDLQSPDSAFVYNHTREYTADGHRDGSWSRYTNHPAIGWAGDGVSSFFASTEGKVFSIRDTGEASDYRDDAQPISAVALLRAFDFGEISTRKMVGNVTIQFGSEETTEDTRVYAAANLSSEFNQLDDFKIVNSRTARTGLADLATYKARPLQFAIRYNRVIHTQLRIENEEKDQGLEIIGASFEVSKLSDRGILQARSTDKS
jgi:hypothetical protein